MSKGTNDKDISDLEREFEEEIKKEELPEESRLPEETELEREYDEEMKGEELPEEKELDPFAERFYELSSRTFKTETELNNAVSGILNEIERDYFFKDLFKKTKKSGQFLLKKGLKMFKSFPAFQAAKAITQLARGNLKGTLGTLAKIGLKGVRTSTGVGTALPILNALGFEIGKGIKQNREAWQNFTNVCKESFDYLARNLNENADDPIEASRLASEAFSTALKKVESERQSASMRRTRKMAVKTSQKKVMGRTVVIALGMVCIVLLAGLVGAIAFYTPMINNLESQTAQKDNTISSLNNTISSLNSQISAINSSTSSKDTQIAALNAQISSLTNILYLNASTYLANNQAITQNAGAYTTIWNDTLNIAGYVTVAVQSSSTTTYVEVTYSTHGVNYDNNATVGTSGTAAFPILPGTIGIRVGNTDLVDSANATVTAIYYY